MKKGLVALSMMALGLASLAQAELVSLYTFDGTADNAVAGAPNGTVAGGAVYVEGKIGTGALSFNGNGQYVNTTTAGLPVAGNGLQTGSIAMWIKTTNTSGKQALMCAANGSTQQSFDIDTTAGGGLTFYLRSIESNQLEAHVSGLSSAFDGEWHYIAYTWNATTGEAGTGSVSVYLDGVAQSVSIANNAITSSDTWGNWDYPMRLAVGGRDNPTWDPFTGSLDDVRVYNSVLSAQEVAALAGVPEPATMSLLVLGAMGILARRKR